MKSEVEKISTVQCRVKIEVPAAEVDKAFDQVFQRIKKKARIQGFRPGKAPLHMIRKMYKDYASSEVVESLINHNLFRILERETLQPIAAPVVENADSPALGKEFKFSAIVDLMPQVELKDYKGIKVQADLYQVTDERIDQEKKQLLRRHGQAKNIDGDNIKADKGHLVTLDHHAKVDGKEIENMHVHGATVALGHNELFEDLEKAIIGMAIGEEKDTKIKLPDTYGDAELAGKEVDFHIKVTGVQELALPEWDDEFAKDMGYESIAKVEETLKEHLESQANQMRQQKLENSIMNKLMETSPFEVPPAMVEQVTDSMIREMGFKSEDEIKQAQLNEQLRAAMREEAKRRTRNTLILYQVIQNEKLEATPEEIQERVEQTLTMMGAGGAPAKQVAAMRQNLKKSVRENLLFTKAVNFLIDNAEITDVPAQL